jgi:hypothetical protein
MVGACVQGMLVRWAMVWFSGRIDLGDYDEYRFYGYGAESGI